MGVPSVFAVRLYCCSCVPGAGNRHLIWAREMGDKTQSLETLFVACVCARYLFLEEDNHV